MNENNNNQNTFACTGDCLKCNFQQRVYCSAQMSRNMLDTLSVVLKNQEDIVARLERIEKSGAEQSEVFNPMGAETTEQENV